MLPILCQEKDKEQTAKVVDNLLSLGWWDGSPRKVVAAKPDGLSLIPGTQCERRDSEGCYLTSTSASWHSYTRTHTQTTATFKRTLCLWEQVVEVLKGKRGSRKISPGEKAQSLAELQLSALTPAANSRWVHGSLLFDVTLVCSLNWITPVASVGCCNLLVNDILLSVCCFSLSATCCLFLISQPFKIKTKSFLDHSSDHIEQSSN